MHVFMYLVCLLFSLSILMAILCSQFSFIFVTAITYIDSSAVQALKDLHQEYKLRDIQVEFPAMQFQPYLNKFLNMCYLS